VVDGSSNLDAGSLPSSIHSFTQK